MTTPPASDQIEAAARVLAARAKPGVALGPFTTYRVGGPAALFFEVDNDGDLALARSAVVTTGIPVLIVGRGSNLLVADSGFPGLALMLGDPYTFIDIAGTRVRAGGATSLPVLARRTAAASLTGLEWAVGVPGSVGGGVRMNAGGHGSDISRTLASVRIADLGEPADGFRRELVAADLDFGYRQSSLSSVQVVLDATFALEQGDRSSSEAAIAEIVHWRRQHQPGGANAGSVFTNPPNDSAGRLIEAAGLKGHRRGSAFVSPKHANFFQVDDGGTAADVKSLMEEVAILVEERTGVRLRPELRLVGFHSRIPGQP